MKLSTPFVVVLAALALTACGGEQEGGIEPPPTTNAAPTTTELVTLPALRWTGDTSAPLPNGWELRGCDGDRTHVCIHDGPDLIGDIELLAGYPLDPADGALDDAATAQRWAQAMIDHFGQDRAQGCPDFTFHGDPVSPVTVGGRPGARGGFTLLDRTGRVVEVVINHYVVVDGRMTIINTDAYVENGGCLRPSEIDPSFTPEQLEQMEQYLDELLEHAPVAE